ncbi:MAG: hypothetical protein U0802_00660 [Candidatus Binatia bacterium]
MVMLTLPQGAASMIAQALVEVADNLVPALLEADGVVARQRLIESVSTNSCAPSWNGRAW